MKTRVTEMLGIRYPIVQGGLALRVRVTLAELVVLMRAVVVALAPERVLWAL